MKISISPDKIRDLSCLGIRDWVIFAQEDTFVGFQEIELSKISITPYPFLNQFDKLVSDIPSLYKGKNKVFLTINFFLAFLENPEKIPIEWGKNCKVMSENGIIKVKRFIFFDGTLLYHPKIKKYGSFCLYQGPQGWKYTLSSGIRRENAMSAVYQF